ncbi:hypothetical protein KC330_g45 [Hortaea werneckii]|nr:hypothetical protein KC330_g45 [Hortaea werneckii]
MLCGLSLRSQSVCVAVEVYDIPGVDSCLFPPHAASSTIGVSGGLMGDVEAAILVATESARLAAIPCADGAVMDSSGFWGYPVTWSSAAMEVAKAGIHCGKSGHGPGR